ncbi:MAG: retroviral-like aspartic protease family protein [Chloroflexi bacterium]|nr:retroviral-like aspartic protease family protein [Chloroflexota bacterium]
MKTRYTQKYNPPVPVLRVRLGYAGNQPLSDSYEAIVDTGADATIVPEEVARKLKATPLNPGQLLTQWGDSHPITIYLLDVQIGDLVLPGVVVAADAETDEVVLGRNILNKLPLFLDGPLQQTDLLDDETVKRLRARQD